MSATPTHTQPTQGSIITQVSQTAVPAPATPALSPAPTEDKFAKYRQRIEKELLRMKAASMEKAVKPKKPKNTTKKTEPFSSSPKKTDASGPKKSEVSHPPGPKDDKPSAPEPAASTSTDATETKKTEVAGKRKSEILPASSVKKAEAASPKKKEVGQLKLPSNSSKNESATSKDSISAPRKTSMASSTRKPSFEAKSAAKPRSSLDLPQPPSLKANTPPPKKPETEKEEVVNKNDDDENNNNNENNNAEAADPASTPTSSTTVPLLSDKDESKISVVIQEEQSGIDSDSGFRPPSQSWWKRLACCLFGLRIDDNTNDGAQYKREASRTGGRLRENSVLPMNVPAEESKDLQVQVPLVVITNHGAAVKSEEHSSSPVAAIPVVKAEEAPKKEEEEPQQQQSEEHSDEKSDVDNFSVVSEAKSEEEEWNFLLPKPLPQHKKMKLLVLDLDETLVHSSFKPVVEADFIIPVEIENQVHHVYVCKRPHVDDFLKLVGPHFEVVIFTASLSKYADPVIDKLDIHKVVHHRLFREACVNHRGTFVKDLSQLGRDLKDIIILDNSPLSYLFHPSNAMPITSWFSEQNDTELKELVPILIDMTKIDNVVTILGEPDNYSQTSPIMGTQSLNAALNPNVPKVQ